MSEPARMLTVKADYMGQEREFPAKRDGKKLVPILDGWKFFEMSDGTWIAHRTSKGGR